MGKNSYRIVVIFGRVSGMRKLTRIIGSIAIISIGIIFAGKYVFNRQFFPFTQPATKTDGSRLAITKIIEQKISTPHKAPQKFEVVAEGLNIPWELVFLPTGEMLVTERPGRLLKIGQGKTTITIEGVVHVGEGGLLGLALHPDFLQNNFLYLYLTTNSGDRLTNRVEKYTLFENELRNRTVILENIPGAQFHDGGRIVFGPDKKLYITTGDAGIEDNAQNKSSLAGKILRLNDDGSIPKDNPFNTAVWSYGHRNPQGLAWDADGKMWATEHGRSGLTSGFDEVNLIERGKNYGWPVIQGDESTVGMETPKAHSGAQETWAPSGASIIGNILLFTGLRGESLYQAKINGTNIENISRLFKNQFGRLRTIVKGPDGQLYLVTNNRDGRGTIKSGDDKIIKIDPAIIDVL